MKDINLQNAWKVHTIHLLEEILKNSQTAILAKPLQIFGTLLYEVGERARELNDPKLNALMCRLVIYEQADPESKEYNPEGISQLMKEVYPELESLYT